MFLYNDELELFHQGLKQRLFSWRGLFRRKMVDFGLCVRVLIVQRYPKIDIIFDFDISSFYIPHFAINIGLVFSIKIIVDSSLSVERSSKKNSLSFAPSTEFHGSRKVQVFLLFCRYSISRISRVFVRENSACASVTNICHKWVN